MGFSSPALVLCVFLLFAVPISIIDIRSYRIPDILSLPCILLILALRAALDIRSFPNYAAAAVFGVALFYCVRRRTKGLGMGDVKFACLVGLCCGLPGIFVALFAASISGIAAVLLLHLFSIKDIKKPIPFAPFLTLGVAAAYCLLKIP
jgi:prepilin signal peptidase PulO-like enzyme (type II secretory pathway)